MGQKVLIYSWTFKLDASLSFCIVRYGNLVAASWLTGRGGKSFLESCILPVTTMVWVILEQHHFNDLTLEYLEKQRNHNVARPLYTESSALAKVPISLLY